MKNLLGKLADLFIAFFYIFGIPAWLVFHFYSMELGIDEDKKKYDNLTRGTKLFYSIMFFIMSVSVYYTVNDLVHRGWSNAASKNTITFILGLSTCILIAIISMFFSKDKNKPSGRNARGESFLD